MKNNIICLIFIFIFLSVFIQPTNSFQKGMSYLTWGTPTIDSAASLESLQNLKSIGTEWIALVITWYQETINSTNIHPVLPVSYTDQALFNFLTNATKMGFKILLKPHVDPQDGKWRAWIGSTFSNEEMWREWFASYDAYILKYAAVAEKFQLPLFSVGVEMITASSHAREFRNLIREVRRIYRGNITYSANWGSQYQVTLHNNVSAQYDIHGEIDDITWLDALDIIGVDAYYYLTNQQNPTYADLAVGWAPIVPHLANISRVHKKQIIFTEIGYRSIEGAAVHPGWWNGTLPVNISQQAVCYEAVFSAFSGQTWWEGVYWWNWYANPDAGGANDQDFTPQHKPAQDVVKLHYMQ